MGSRRSQEGYLQIDHRDSPGIAPKGAVIERPDRPFVGAGVNYESAVVRCSQCHRLVVLNPKRERPRHYCPKCNGYHCDGCVASHEYGHCETLDQVFDRVQRETELLITKG